MKQAKFAVAFAGLLLSLVTLCSLPACAQQFFGSITGTVTDPSGAVLPNANVRVINVNTNVTLALKTNGAGVYVASNLIAGTYRVEAEAAGFKRTVADRITVDVGTTPKVDLALSVGQSSESVTVTENNAPILQTQQTDLGQTVDTSELQNLPIEAGTYSSGRSPYSLLSLAAGVSQQTGCTGGGTGGGGLGSCGNEGNVRISGSRPRTDDN